MRNVALLVNVTPKTVVALPLDFEKVTAIKTAFHASSALSSVVTIELGAFNPIDGLESAIDGNVFTLERNLERVGLDSLLVKVSIKPDGGVTFTGGIGSKSPDIPLSSILYAYEACMEESKTKVIDFIHVVCPVGEEHAVEVRKYISKPAEQANANEAIIANALFPSLMASGNGETGDPSTYDIVSWAYFSIESSALGDRPIATLARAFTTTNDAEHTFLFCDEGESDGDNVLVLAREDGLYDYFLYQHNFAPAYTVQSELTEVEVVERIYEECAGWTVQSSTLSSLKTNEDSAIMSTR